MKILVTGASGMLGQALCHELTAGDYYYIGTDSAQLDITKLNQVLGAIENCRPDIVINAAAYTDVDGCEANRDLALNVNGLGPRNLAIACEKTGAALVQISTDYVFTGNARAPYNEFAQTGPLSVYGWSKLAGEMNVRHHTNRFYNVRTSWLYGEHGNNFVATMLKLAKERDEIDVVNDQMGSPTYTGDLAKAIFELITEPAYGTYHLTNSGTCTWYDFTLEIFKQAGINNVKVKPITTEEISRPAPRPAYSVMDNYIWRLQGKQPLRHYKEALADYLKSFPKEEKQ